MGLFHLLVAEEGVVQAQIQEPTVVLAVEDEADSHLATQLAVVIRHLRHHHLIQTPNKVMAAALVLLLVEIMVQVAGVVLMLRPVQDQAVQEQRVVMVAMAF